MHLLSEVRTLACNSMKENMLLLPTPSQLKSPNRIENDESFHVIEDESMQEHHPTDEVLRFGIKPRTISLQWSTNQMILS